MTRDKILNMPAGREMDVTVGYHAMGLVAPPEIYPEYSTDIVAAWEVMEKMKFHLSPFGGNKGLWMCYDNHDLNVAEIITVAETAPLSICRAALLAVMEIK